MVRAAGGARVVVVVVVARAVAEVRAEAAAVAVTFVGREGAGLGGLGVRVGLEVRVGRGEWVVVGGGLGDLAAGVAAGRGRGVGVRVGVRVGMRAARAARGVSVAWRG
jgi:hypothetical protein